MRRRRRDAMPGVSNTTMANPEFIAIPKSNLYLSIFLMVINCFCINIILISLSVLYNSVTMHFYIEAGVRINIYKMLVNTSLA